MIINLEKLDAELAKYGYIPNRYALKKFEVPAMTSYDFFYKNCRKFANLDCFNFGLNKIKYYEVNDRSIEFAKALTGLGIKNRDRVGTLMPNIPEAAYIQKGLWRIGGIVDHIDPRTNPQIILEFAKKEKLRSFVVVDVLYDYTIKPIEKELREMGVQDIIIIPSVNSIHPLLKSMVNLKDFLQRKQKVSSNILNIYYWEELIKNSRYQILSHKEFVPNEVSTIVHSSGTSSAMPKAIPLTNENINSIVIKHQLTNLPLNPGKRFLHILPYFAAYGCVNSAHLAMNLGMELIEVPEFSFEDFGPLLLKYKPNIVLGVPNWWKILVRDPRMQNADLSFLEIAVAGGDSINQKDEEEINDFLVKHNAKCLLTKGHGMSEIAGCGTFTFDGYNNIAGLGTSFPTDRYILLDSSGKIISNSGEQIKGEAYIYSPSATGGIIDGESIVGIKYIAGYPFIQTKDTIILNSDNTLEFSERIDRTFTRFDGYKVRPYNIEKTIEKSQKVQECMVVEYEDDELYGKMPIAHIVLNEELSEDEKYELVRNIIDSYMTNSVDFTTRDIPKKWRFRENIPQTKMFKKDYKKLISEGLTGEEFTVTIKESNLKVESIVITKPKSYIKKLSYKES